MKKLLFVLFVVSTSAAFAQNLGNSINSQAQSYSFQTHPGHATYVPLTQEQSVLPTSTYLTAQGDRRPSDFAQPEAAPLGTIARELRKQHAQLKKSPVVWVNQ
jgi:hypothetical protein